MSDPTAVLQAAIVPVLKVDSGLSALIGTRIYDTPPPSPVFPYVSVGEDQFVKDRADCYTGGEATLVFHVWSREVGFLQAKRVGAALVEALDGLEIDLSSGQQRLVDLLFDSSNYIRDPDGLTSHGIVTFTALIEPV